MVKEQSVNYLVLFIRFPIDEKFRRYQTFFSGALNEQKSPC